MGHTKSNTALATAVLRSPLEEFAGSKLAVNCRSPGCPRGRAHDVAGLSRFYRGLTVFQAISRMRCETCGRPPAEARMIRMVGHPRDRGVALMGPGSS